MLRVSPLPDHWAALPYSYPTEWGLVGEQATSASLPHKASHVCLHIYATDISVPIGKIPNEEKENILGGRNKLKVTLISVAGTRQGEG